MRQFLTYLLLTTLLFISNSVLSQTRDYVLSSNIGTGVLVPHHSNMRYLVTGYSPTIEILWEERNADSTHYGIGLKYLNSGNQKYIGNIWGAYGYASFPLAKRLQNTRFIVGFGFGYVEKIFDKQNNIQNIAIGSHYNANVSMRLNQEFIIDNKHLLNLGIGITHYSNGSYQTPNLGLNYLIIRAGYGFIKGCGPNTCKPPKTASSLSLEPKFHYNLSIASGIHENIQPLRGKYPLVNIGFRVYPRSKYNKKFVCGADAFYNPAIQHTNDSTQSISPYQGGLFIGTEFDYKKLALGIEMGSYIFNQDKTKGNLYHRFSINYVVSRKTKVFIQLKSHWAVAEALELGVNYRLR